MMDDVELIPNADAVLWALVDSILADLAASGVKVDERVADAVACLAGQQLTLRVREITEQWLLTQKTVDDTAGSAYSAFRGDFPHVD
jgi:hypothetical protein